MGSYLRNCFISNQVIPSNAEVIVIPIIQSQGYESLALRTNGVEPKFLKGRQAYQSICYTNAFWKAMGMYMEGKGDDSYRIELIDTPFHRRSLLVFFGKIYQESLNVGDEKEVVLDVKELMTTTSPGIVKLLSVKAKDVNSGEIDTLDWEEFKNLWEAVEEQVDEQQIFIKPFFGGSEPVPVQFAVCLKSAYNYLVNYSTESLRFINHTFEHEMELLREGSELSVKNRNRSAYLVAHSMYRLEGGSQANCSYNSYLTEILSEYDWDNDENYTEENFRAIKSRFKLIEDFMNFQMNLSQMNILLKPVHGASQDYSNTSGLEYAKMVNQISQINKDFLRSQGYFEDEED